MTLIIGGRFKNGVMLVADRKVVEEETNDESWENKIIQPTPGAPLSFGAAGYSHLFKQFNRKLPVKVQEKMREVHFKNIKVFKDLGLEPPELPKVETEPKKIQMNEVTKYKKGSLPLQGSRREGADRPRPAFQRRGQTS